MRQIREFKYILSGSKSKEFLKANTGIAPLKVFNEINESWLRFDVG